MIRILTEALDFALTLRRVMASIAVAAVSLVFGIQGAWESGLSLEGILAVMAAVWGAGVLTVLATRRPYLFYAFVGFNFFLFASSLFALIAAFFIHHRRCQSSPQRGSHSESEDGLVVVLHRRLGLRGSRNDQEPAKTRGPTNQPGATAGSEAGS